MVLRLARVAGQEARANDVVFQPAVRRTARPRALVFFGGDVQDYSEAMRSHRDNRRYLRWSLERTTRRLAACFPAHHVLAVRPARIERKMLSCYDNFVPSDCAGVPRFTPAHGALAHLHSLLQNLSLRLRETPSSELLLALAHTEDDEIDAQAGAQSSTTPCQAEPSDAAGGSTVHAAESPESPDPLWWVCGLRLERCELALAGFSKGCVVLNQLVHELHHGGAQPPGLVSQISSLYWLDGGHAGGRDTWLTARPLLHTLAQLDVNIFVHVSPYQVRDEARPWIRREEKIFTNTLTKLGAKVSRYFHASPAPYSLLTHFSVLDNFKRVQDEDHPGLDTHNK